MSGDSYTAIMAVCRDKVDDQTDKIYTTRTLRKFITKANLGLRAPYRVLLFAKPDDDVKAVLSDNSQSDAFESVEPLRGKGSKAMGNFPNSYSKVICGAGRVSRLALIELNQPAASKHGLCFVSIEAFFQDVENCQYEETIGFRCAFFDVPAAISALEDLEATSRGPEGARILRNEAVRCGGIWSPGTMAQLHANEQSRIPRVLRAHLDLATYPPFRGIVSPEANRVKNPGVSPMVPIFITAENITVETVNEFLEAAELPQSQRADRKISRITIVTNISLDSDTSTSGPVVSPLKALPALPQELMHASPEACGAFARSRFPTQKQLISWDEFIVMDGFSESRKTVILGAYDGHFRNGLVLNRTALGTLWTVLAVVETSPKSYDMRADVSSRADDRVDRFVYSWME
ncbi:hypothetical protein PspLS_07531 [Pyricularia sp. CBS 133598]|nr:hypothetical protein PspLS_07531 [Pyricularia sp. CBS 133598]